MQAQLAFSCKALLPILGMGHVRVRIDKHKDERPLLDATRCLMKQPGSASHLEVYSVWVCLGTCHLIDLRCAHAPMLSGACMGVAPAPAVPWSRVKAGADAAVRFRSLLANLRKLTLHRVAVSLPALQPVATRLHELHMPKSRLQNSADGFLTRGWTALTTLSLENALVETATMTAALVLPALEEMNMEGFRHQGGVLQLDQLTGSCPHVTGLSFQLDERMMRGRQNRQCCSLRSLGRLADLCMSIYLDAPYATMDLDLPAGLTHLKLQDDSDGSLNFFWALNEAAKCVRRGAHLRELVCIHTEADLQAAQWGASLDGQYRRLGGQLTSLHELEVLGDAGLLLTALGAVLSSAPSLAHVRLTFVVMEFVPHMELSPICSASLESITVCVDDLTGEPGDPDYCIRPPLPPLVLTFLPGCTRLLKVLVQYGQCDPTNGSIIKIHCHCCSSMCIVPLNVHACLSGNVSTDPSNEVGVQFLPGPPGTQGVQWYTVLYACHAAGPQQPLVWGHVVMPGFL